MKTIGLLIIAIWICTIGIDAQEMFTFQRITSEPAREGFATWSPQGDSLIYQYTSRDDSAGQNGLWKVALDGTGAKQIFSGLAEHPRWSPDGRHVVFDADTGNSIKMMPANGGTPVTFLPDSIHIYRGGLPCWSPDASQIAFIEGATASLCVYHPNTGHLERIFSQEGMVPLPGCYSSDGQ